MTHGLYIEVGDVVCLEFMDNAMATVSGILNGPDGKPELVEITLPNGDVYSGPVASFEAAGRS